MDAEQLKDGPSVEPWDTWHWNHKPLRVEKLVWCNDVLYADCERTDDFEYPRSRHLVPVLKLLCEGRKDGYPYPETVRCRKCGVEATGTEVELENAGWWLMGMGSGPLCPQHSES